MTFFHGQSFAIGLKESPKHFLTKIMLLNEIQAFFFLNAFSRKRFSSQTP